MYRSPTFGDIVLDIPKHPDEEGGRGLFAHYLWSAATIVAAGVEFGSLREGSKGEGKKNGWWDFRGCRVLEVGAGMFLCLLVILCLHLPIVAISVPRGGHVALVLQATSNFKSRNCSQLR